MCLSYPALSAEVVYGERERGRRQVAIVPIVPIVDPIVRQTRREREREKGEGVRVRVTLGESMVGSIASFPSLPLPPPILVPLLFPSELLVRPSACFVFLLSAIPILGLLLSLSPPLRQSGAPRGGPTRPVRGATDNRHQTLPASLVFITRASY